MDSLVSENLKASSVIIDRTRSEGYTKRGRQFSHAFAASLGVDLNKFREQAESAGLKLALINYVFENAPDKATAEQIFGQIEPALKFPACDELLYGMPDTEMDAIRTRVSFITSTGYRRLASRDASLANTWLSKWTESISSLCHEELQKTYLRLGDSPEEHYSAANIEDGVKLYLENFSKTGASEVALIGNFPFTENPTSQLLDLYGKVGDLISPIFRFAQDVIVNPGEKVNTGLFAYAVSKSLNLDEVRTRLSDPMTKDILQLEMVKIWQNYIGEQMARLAELIKGNPEYSDYLKGTAQLMEGIIKELSTNWQKIG